MHYSNNIYIYMCVCVCVCAPKIWLMGLTYTWAHNLFVQWVLRFLLWVVLGSETLLHSLWSLLRASLVFLTKLPPLLLIWLPYFLSFSPQNHPCPLDGHFFPCVFLRVFSTLTSHSILLFKLEISGGVMIIPDYQWEWGSNSIVSKWMFHWEWQ